MLNPTQIRMCQLLDKQISNCRKCRLYGNGKCIPHWNANSKYAIIGQSPTFHDTRRKTFFSGQAGNILISELGAVGFKASQFLIINSVQCRVTGANHGHPSEEQLDFCKEYIRKYLKVIRPEKILCLGNYAKYMFSGNTTGVLRQRGRFEEFDFGHNIFIPVLYTINPSYCIHNREGGLEMLKEDILLFKETDFQRKSDWLLSEEDFLV
jgi:uracil-DNA glycosylase family 4